MTDYSNSPTPSLSDQDALLISAYLDDMLSDDERRTFEQRLNEDRFLQDELGAMRATVALIKQLPILKAPRDFTLSADDVAESSPTPSSERVLHLPNRAWWFMGSLAALFAVILGMVYLNQVTQPTTQSANPVAMGMTATLDTDPSESTTISTLEAPMPSQSNVYIEDETTLTVTPLPTMVSRPGDDESDETTRSQDAEEVVASAEDDRLLGGVEDGQLADTGTAPNSREEGTVASSAPTSPLQVDMASDVAEEEMAVAAEDVSAPMMDDDLASATVSVDPPDARAYVRLLLWILNLFETLLHPEASSDIVPNVITPTAQP